MNGKSDINRVVDKYADVIYKILYRKLKNKEDCEDLIQELFIKYVKHIKEGNEFDTEEKEKCWLIRIALNLCFNKCKYNKIRKTMPLEENICYNEDLSCDNKVKIAANKLEKKYKDVFELFYIDDLNVSEISKILEINEPNVRTRLKRAREKVREIILKGERING